MITADEFIKQRQKKAFKRSISKKSTLVRLNDFTLDNKFEVYEKDETHVYLLIPATFPKQPQLGIKHSVQGYLQLTPHGFIALKEVHYLFDGDELNPLYNCMITKRGEYKFIKAREEDGI